MGILDFGLDLLGSAIGFNQAENASARANEFSERMSSTSYQRGVKDMQAAGLNPMLAYMHGGASTPSGAVSGNVTNPMSSAINSARAVDQTRSQVGLQSAQVSQIAADTALKGAETETQRTQAALNVANAKRLRPIR